MTRTTVVIKKADSRGRITFKKSFANRTVLVEERGDGIVLRLARTRVIAEREAWLYESEKAWNALRRGHTQARSGKFGKAPELAATARLARKIQDG